MIKKTIKFLTSIRTSLWLLSFLIILFFAGAFIMPLRKEFQSIHSVPLFWWLKEQPLSATWWIWGSISLLSLLTANTLFCSIDSIIKKRQSTQWLLIIAPQVIHIGFLFILFAHVVSSLGGFRGYSVAGEWTMLNLPSYTVQINSITISIDPDGYITDWAVNIGYISEGKVLQKDRIMPNKPSFQDGIGLYVRDIQAYPVKAILLEVSREPGALWALVGGILFMIGTIMLLILKIKRTG